jgi:predicted dehydrogenase
MSKILDQNRRGFLKNSARTAAGLAALKGISFITQADKVFGANDRVRVGICGLNGRGNAHIKGYARLSNVEIAALCDIDESVLNKRSAELKDKGIQPKTYVDVRKLLEDKSVDAISIATPNHWHTLMAIWGCQAGKDVYVEKPCTHNLWEGRQLIRAAEKYGRIVQHGTQNRSNPVVMEAVQKMQQGSVGDLYLSRGLCYKWRDTIGRTPVSPVPAGVNYDLWTGPAPAQPFTRNHFHYNWHWFWAYGNGDVGNQGVHQMDIARWGLGVKFPSKISAIGGHVMFDDDQQTPNVLNCAFEFDLPDGKRRLLEFEVRHWITNHEADVGKSSERPAPRDVKGPRLGSNVGDHNTVGNIFYGSQGYLGIDGDNVFKSWIGPDQQPGPCNSASGKEDHFANFVACVIDRKKENLRAPVEEGHISCALIHLANASYRLGRTLNFDAQTQQVLGDDEANRLLRDADRGYRAPFAVPDKV